MSSKLTIHVQVCLSFYSDYVPCVFEALHHFKCTLSTLDICKEFEEV